MEKGFSFSRRPWLSSCLEKFKERDFWTLVFYQSKSCHVCVIFSVLSDSLAIYEWLWKIFSKKSVKERKYEQFWVSSQITINWHSSAEVSGAIQIHIMWTSATRYTQSNAPLFQKGPKKSQSNKKGDSKIELHVVTWKIWECTSAVFQLMTPRQNIVNLWSTKYNKPLYSSAFQFEEQFIETKEDLEKLRSGKFTDCGLS